GDIGDELGGSEYLKRIHGLKQGAPPRMNLAQAKAISDFILEIIRRGWVKSAHDCSEGGLAVALAECCISNGEAMIGATVDLPVSAAALFGETQSRILISCAPEQAGKIPGFVLGTTGGSDLKIKMSPSALSWDLADLRDVWWNAISRLME